MNNQQQVPSEPAKLVVDIVTDFAAKFDQLQAKVNDLARKDEEKQKEIRELQKQVQGLMFRKHVEAALTRKICG